MHAFVFARGGSKGVPGKNTRALAGRPLIAYSLEMALSVPEVSRVFASTDDPEIALIARALGAEIIDRPPELARDDSPEWLAWQHAAAWVASRYGSFDRLLSLPATSPMRSIEDVDSCVAALKDDVDMAVCITQSARSPWFSTVTVDERGHLRLLMDDERRYDRRQDVPEAFDLTTVAYAAWTRFVLDSRGMWSGRVRGVEIPRERAVDIDTPLDFEFAEFLMTRRRSEGG